MGVPDTGIAGIAQGIANQFTHFAHGTDATAFAGSQTALFAETDRFDSLTTSLVSDTVTNDTARFEGTYTFPADRTGLNEIGLFDAGAGGNMGFRQTHGDLNTQDGDEIFVRGQVTVRRP